MFFVFFHFFVFTVSSFRSYIISQRFTCIKFCFLLLFFITWFLPLFCSVKRQRNESDVWGTSSRTMSAFPEGPPVLDYREPGPHPKGLKYQNTLKTLIPFRFGQRLEIHFILFHLIISVLFKVTESICDQLSIFILLWLISESFFSVHTQSMMPVFSPSHHLHGWHQWCGSSSGIG